MNEHFTCITAGGVSARKRSGLTASVTSMPTMPEEEDIHNMSPEEILVRYQQLYNSWQFFPSFSSHCFSPLYDLVYFYG